MKLSNVKISPRIISYIQWQQISDSRAFRLTQQSSIIHSDNLCCIMPDATAICTPCYIAEPPLISRLILRVGGLVDRVPAGAPVGPTVKLAVLWVD